MLISMRKVQHEPHTISKPQLLPFEPEGLKRTFLRPLLGPTLPESPLVARLLVFIMLVRSRVAKPHTISERSKFPEGAVLLMYDAHVLGPTEPIQAELRRAKLDKAEPRSGSSRADQCHAGPPRRESPAPKRARPNRGEPDCTPTFDQSGRKKYK